jgi:hypothetical protein
MTTGLHVIRAVYCNGCDASVGWFYEFAFEEDQKYKEGHYILEMNLIEETLSSFDDSASVSEVRSPVRVESSGSEY